MKSESFFSLLFRQKYIKRWSLMRNTTPETLSEHSAETAAIAHALALIGNTRFGKHYDADRACVIALFHDAPEVFTGDLPTPVKYFNSKTREDYGVIEKQAIETMLSKLPDELCDDYRPLLSEDDDDKYREERRLVHIADKLCAYIKCINEEACGNTEFAKARASTEAKLDSIDSEELVYFREHFIPSFRKTIDEM